MLNLRLQFPFCYYHFPRKALILLPDNTEKFTLLSHEQRENTEQEITSDNGIKLKEDKIPLRHYHQQR